jgi:hypothetical protein
MIQILKREELKRTEKETVEAKNIQVCFNNYGHLSVRLINDSKLNQMGQTVENDVLIVFNQYASLKIIEFIQGQLKQATSGSGINFDDLPF